LVPVPPVAVTVKVRVSLPFIVNGPLGVTVAENVGVGVGFTFMVTVLELTEEGVGALSVTLQYTVWGEPEEDAV
jgi:hypothetical protein